MIDSRIDTQGKLSGQIKTTCPECSATRKKSNERCLSVNLDEGVWNCHHCGWAGPDEYAEERKTFAFNNNWLDLKQITIDWLENRGFSLDTIKHFKVGNGVQWMPQTSQEEEVMGFPYYYKNRLVNVKYRDFNKNFRQEKNGMKIFWNVDNINSDEPLIITEGELDAMAVYEAGYSNVVSIPNGAPNPNTKHYAKIFDYFQYTQELFKQIPEFIICVDNDEAGRQLKDALVQRLQKERCSIVSYPDRCKDANDVIKRYSLSKLQECLQSRSHYPVEGLYEVKHLEDRVLDYYENGFTKGLTTGWDALDEYYTVRPQEMTIVTGIPNHGKSTWVNALTVNLYKKHGWRFVYCSPEILPLEKHISILSAMLKDKPFNRGPNPRMSREELKEALNEMQGNFNFILLKNEQMSVENVMKRVKIQLYRYGVNGIVLDPWNELDHSRPTHLSEHEYISQTLTKLRRFARMADIHLWIVAHPKKPEKLSSGKYRPPNLYHVSGSATWNDKADNGITVYRPEVNKDVSDIYVTKIRYQGEVGKRGQVQFQFHRPTSKYMNGKAIIND